MFFSQGAMQLLASMVLLAALGAHAGPLQPNASAALVVPQVEAEYRIPGYILPVSYDISIIPYFNEAPSDEQQFTFGGIMKMTFRALQAVPAVRLHAKDMNITKVSVKQLPQATALELFNRFTQSGDDKDFLDIMLTGALVANQITLYEMIIEYKGKLNEELDGFYRSSYVNYRGDTVWLGVTQFEPTGARRAFPCLDEPSYKSKFTLHIAKEPLREVTANMPIQASNRPVSGLESWVWVDFKQSVLMPTYLVAFAVHDFGFVENQSEDKEVNFKVYARREFLSSSSKYASDITPHVLKYFETFTNIKYDRSMKVDQIALPDFAAGAMENWGLITYREVNLLHDKFYSTAANKQRIVTVITHELAHQWFGNLVSPEWWSQVWLNEGFATYFEFFAAKYAEPLFQLEEAFIREELQQTFITDSLDSTHPLTTPVDTPASASAAFDNIAYGKGACIVRFLNTLLGSTHFQTGVRNYLNENKYNSVTKDSLVASLKAVTPAGTLPEGVAFEKMMNTWVEQAGYPLITATRNYNTKAITFTQERFHSTKKAAPGAEKWFVPITLIRERDNGNWQDLSTKGWVVPSVASTTFTTILPENSEWIVVNPRQTGYYRVNYDEENWKKIISTLNDKDKWSIIMEINRAQVIDDSMALAKGKYLSYDIALATTEYLGHETMYLPWTTAIRSFNFIGDRLIGEPNARRQYFQLYMMMKLRPMYATLNGFTMATADGHVIRLLRALVLQWACNLGHDECRAEASRLFQEWKQRSSPDYSNPIEPDLRSVVYCHGMQNDDDFEFLFTRYTKAQQPSEMDTLLASLGCAPTEELLKRVLNETIKIEGQQIRFQDTRTAFISVINNPEGIDIALDFLVTQFDKIKVTYQAFGSVTRLFSAIATKLNTVDQTAKLQKFLTDNPSEPSNIKSAVEAAMAVVDENIAWLTANKENVMKFFEVKVKNGAGMTYVSPMVLICVAVIKFLL